MSKTEVVYINVGVMDDEPKAKQRAVRFIENWSFDLQKPGSPGAQTVPLLWEWLILKRYKEDKIANKSATAINPDVINVKARIIITADTPTEFESKIDERTRFRDIDVIVSDVVIPDDQYNGLEFAKRWNNKRDAPVFIMVSAHDLAIQAFNINVADYILKPLRTNTLSLGLCRAITQKASNDSINSEWQDELKNFIKKGKELVINVTSAGNKYHSILIDDIIMFKSETKCTMVVTKNKEYFYEHSLKKISEMYKTDFVKIRRNYLISINHIVGFTNKSKREELNKDVKGRIWYVKTDLSGEDEYIEIARREWSKIYRLFEINPNIHCKIDFYAVSDELKKDVKNKLANSDIVDDEYDDEYGEETD